MRRIFTLLMLFAASSMPAGIAAQSVSEIRSAENGLTTEQSRDAKWYLTQHQRLAADIAALQPQTKGVIEAFVVAVGMDADPVFARESKEAAKVLSARFGANGRVILLASGDNSLAAQGSPVNIATALAAVAAKMDLNEDVLVLYTTSHGSAKTGIVYQDGQNSFGMVSPSRLANLINGLGIKRRLIIVSACYSGVFIPSLASDDTIIITAASERRTSFGCNPGNDWTFFGDALINHALRTPVALEQAAKDAKKQIFDWENHLGLISSEPQVSIGSKSAIWLAALEANIANTVSMPVGRPAIEGDVKAATK